MMKTTGNSRPLALWSVISVTLPDSSSYSSCSETSDTCSRNSARLPSGDRCSNSAATPPSSRRFSILPSASTVRSLELEQVAGLGGRRLDHPLRRRARLERLLQALHHADPAIAPFAAPPDPGNLVSPPGRLEERDLLDRREPLERGHGRVADAALGRVDHPPRADHVLRVQQQPQVREDVLDLLALVEPNAEPTTRYRMPARMKMSSSTRLWAFVR